MAVITSVTLNGMGIAHGLVVHHGIEAEFVPSSNHFPHNFDGILILIDTSTNSRPLDVPLNYGHWGIKKVLHLISSPHEVQAPANKEDYTIITGVVDFESTEIRSQIERFIEGNLNSLEKRR